MQTSLAMHQTFSETLAALASTLSLSYSSAGIRTVAVFWSSLFAGGTSTGLVSCSLCSSSSRRDKASFRATAISLPSSVARVMAPNSNLLVFLLRRLGWLCGSVSGSAALGFDGWFGVTSIEGVEPVV